MRRLFGGSKKKEEAPVPSLSDTSEGVSFKQMDKRADVIKQKIDQCDQELAQLKNQMKQSRNSPIYRQRAMQVIKRRRMYMTQYETIMGQQFNIDQVKFAQESVQDTINTANAMKQAVALQKQQMKQMKLNEMEDIMDDMEELMIDTEEMNEIMSRNYGVEIDEGELEDELAALDDEILEDYMGESQIKAPNYLPQPQQRNEDPMLDFPSPPS